MSSPPSRHRLDGGNDVGIGAAAAEIAAHEFANAGIRGRATFLDERDGRHDLARGAIAALEAVMFDKGRLHGMKRLATRQPLYRGNRLTLDLSGEGEAGDDAFAIDVDGAGTACPHVATFLRASHAKTLPQ